MGSFSAVVKAGLGLPARAARSARSIQSSSRCSTSAVCGWGSRISSRLRRRTGTRRSSVSFLVSRLRAFRVAARGSPAGVYSKSPVTAAAVAKHASTSRPLAAHASATSSSKSAGGSPIRHKFCGSVTRLIRT